MKVCVWGGGGGGERSFSHAECVRGGGGTTSFWVLKNTGA